MKISIFSTNNFPTAKWWGGSTTQLYIFPEDASLAERNFELRLSTAVVETAQSTFTLLPGVKRKLMILEGEIKISHEGQYSKNLKPFEVENFTGDWKTTAVGLCRDFNVMTIGEIKSDLYYLKLNEVLEYHFTPINNFSKLFFYIISGTANLKLSDENHRLEKESLIKIENFNNNPILISNSQKLEFVVVEIF